MSSDIRHNGYRMQGPARVAAFSFSALVFGFAIANATAIDPQIQSQLRSRYDDTTLFAVDIPMLRIVGGRSRGATGKTLQLLLPRNFITSFVRSGQETAVILQLDTETKAPWVAIAPPERSYTVTDAKPDLSRMLTLLLHNLLAETGLRYQSERLETCRGKELAQNLREYDAKDRVRCFRPSFPQGEKFIAAYNEELSLVVECHPGANVSPCKVSFPFDSLAVEVTFARSQLLQWRKMISIARDFLESKRTP